MNTQLKSLALAAACVSSVLYSPPAFAAERTLPSPAKRTHAEARQLLRSRDEARPRAKAAEQRLRDSGLSPSTLGFESAKILRNRQAASERYGKAYADYVRTAKKLEKQIQAEVKRGVKPLICVDIARFERLQAEVDLARFEGRLPAQKR